MKSKAGTICLVVCQFIIIAEDMPRTFGKLDVGVIVHKTFFPHSLKIYWKVKVNGSEKNMGIILGSKRPANNSCLYNSCLKYMHLYKYRKLLYKVA